MAASAHAAAIHVRHPSHQKHEYHSHYRNVINAHVLPVKPIAMRRACRHAIQAHNHQESQP
jgi:hypothetical protein